MATSYSPKIVTDGLIMCVDFSNPKSYTSGSAKFNNLVNSSETGSVSNPLFTQIESGLGLQFTQQYATQMQTNHNSLTNATYITWMKFPTTASANVNRKFWGTLEGAGSNIYGFQTIEINAAGEVIASNGKGSPPDVVVSSSVNVHDGLWHMIVYQYSVGDKLYLQIDSNRTIGPSFPSKGQQGILSGIGADYNLNNSISASISTVMWYDRVLTEAELKQNYDALRSKFGV